MAVYRSQNTGGPSGSSKFLKFFLIIFLGGLGLAGYLVFQPQDLSDLQRQSSDAAVPVERDLKVVLRNAIDRNFPVTLSQVELNDWLASKLATREKATFERVWVRLQEGVAEVVMERELWGHPFTVSMYLQIERMEGPEGKTTEIQLHGGPFHKDFPKPSRGGRFGQLVVPQGFLLLVMSDYQNLANIFSDEINLAFRDMKRIQIEKERLVLDPREPADDEGVPKPF